MSASEVTRGLARAALHGSLRSVVRVGTFLDRREFLVAAGSVAAVSIAQPAVAEQLEITRLPPTSLPLERRPLRIAAGQGEWIVDPRAFSEAATLTYQPLDENSFHVISLIGAHYPGTDLVADFVAELYPRNGVWLARLSFAAVERAVEIPVGAWMRARVSEAAASVYEGVLSSNRTAIAIGNGTSRLILPRGQARLRIDARFAASIVAAKGLQLVSPRLSLALASAELELSANPSGFVPEGIKGPVTNMKLEGARAQDDEVLLTRIKEHPHLDDQQSAHLVFDGVPNASLICFGAARQRDAVLQLGGPRSKGTLVVHGAACGPHGARVQLERWVLLGRANALGKSLRFAATIAAAARGHGLETDCAAVVIAGEPTEIVEQEFTDRPIESLSFRAWLYAAYVPVTGASGADVAFNNTMVNVHFGRAPEAKASGGDPPRATCEATLAIGSSSSTFEAPLEQARLRLRRSLDGFDLAYGFTHYALRVSGGVTTLVQRWAFEASCSALGGLPRLIVHFPPQCEFEEAFAPTSDRPPGACVAPAPDPVNGANKCRPQPPVKRRAIFETSQELPNLARTKIAGPTRLVFEDRSADSEAKRGLQGDVFSRELTIEFLTDWQELALVVSKRALTRSATLQQQLDVVGILPNDSRQIARDKVRRLVQSTLTQKGELRSDETSIEPVYRMLVSPDPTASWTTPRTPPDRRRPKLWTTEMKDADSVAVRALWARGMDLGFLEQNGAYTPGAFESHFVGSLDGNDRRELVALTSFYGLAALRRLIPPPPPTPGAPTPPTPLGGWVDDPNGMVFLPTEKYQFIDWSKPKEREEPNDPKWEIPQEGVMLAKPFDRYRLRLGRFADVDAFWKGEPPAGYTGGNLGPFFAPAFTIERYLHRATQGRDAFVEVTYKGFAFPFGHRVAYLKVTQRDFKAYLDNPIGDPTAYLIQDFYIVCRHPKKTFKAYNQPYASNDFPCESVELVTTETGSLADPCPIPELEGSGRDKTPSDECRPIAGKVFWPRLLKSESDVEFEYRIDGDPKTARSPLLFVDNAAAHHPQTMQRVVEYYNSATRPDLLDPNFLANQLPNASMQRVVHHAGQTRRYAPEERRGTCSFRTYHWILSARGRLTVEPTGDPSESFHMDAFMEGQDQPPFYPVVEMMSVAIEPIERLTGKQGLRIATAFNANYVRNGFDPTRNPSEIYLDILRPDLSLDGYDSGGATGGVATLAAKLAGLSRKIGPVGGRNRGAGGPGPTAPPSALAAPSSAKAVVGGSEPRRYDMGAAEAGGFDPLAFLGGALNEAKLLGIVPLKDVLKAVLISAAPKLIEKVNYGAAQVQEQGQQYYDTLKRIFGTATADLISAIDTIKREAEAALAKLGTGLTLKDLYPEFTRALDTLRDRASSANAFFLQPAPADATRLAAALAAAYDQIDALKTAADDVLHALERIGRDPVPSVVRDVLKQIQDAWKLVREFSTAIEDQIRALVKSLIEELLEKVCHAAIEDGVFEAIVGRFDWTDTVPKDQLKERQLEACKRILRNPADTLPRLQEALLFEVIGEPFANAVKAVNRLGAGLSRAIAWSRQTVATAISAVLRRGASEVADTVFAVPVQNMVAAIEADTQAILLDQPLDRILPALAASVDKAFRAQVADMRQRIQNYRAVVIKAANEKQQEITSHLAREAREAVTPEMQAAYEQLVMEWRRLTLAAEQAQAIASILADAGKWQALVDTLKALKAEIEKEFRRAVEEGVRSLDAALKAEADGVAKRLLSTIDDLLKMVLGSATVRQLCTAASQITGDWCKSETGLFVGAVEAVTFGLVGDDRDIEDQLRKVENILQDVSDTIARLTVADPVPRDAREAVSAASAALTRSVTLVKSVSADLAALRADWGKFRKDGICKDPKVILNPVGRIVDVRRRAGAAIADGLQAAKALIDKVQLAASPLSARTLAGPLATTLKQAANDLQRTEKNGKEVVVGLVAMLRLMSSFPRVASGGGGFGNLNTAVGELKAKAGTAKDQLEKSCRTSRGRQRTSMVAWRRQQQSRRGGPAGNGHRYLRQPARPSGCEFRLANGASVIRTFEGDRRSGVERRAQSR